LGGALIAEETVIGAPELDVRVTFLVRGKGISHGFPVFGGNVLVQASPDE
jgi:hypothetical protein